MKILATSAYETHEMLDVLLITAAKDRLGKHSLCDSAEEADIILFVENTHFDDYLFKQVLEHPLALSFPEKTFMYNEADKPWSALPGLYCAMPQRFLQPNKQVSFPYLQTPNDFIKDVHKWDVEKRWLFSFVGAASHRCRRDVIALAHKSKGVQDTSDFNVWDCTADAKAAQGINFAQTMAETQFMLCPRGIGTSSFRLFETLEAGRAPVIIADQWVPTPHINWDFAVRVDENDIKSIPSLLRSMSDESEERGRAARAAWESAYAPEVLFDTVGESLEWLLEQRLQIGIQHPLRRFRKFAISADMALIGFARGARRQLQQVLF